MPPKKNKQKQRGQQQQPQQPRAGQQHADEEIPKMNIPLPDPNQPYALYVDMDGVLTDFEGLRLCAVSESKSRC